MIHHMTMLAALRRKQTKRAVNMMVYIIGIGGNIAVVPQIVKAWESDAPGLAVTTWLFFTAIGIIWLVYAYQHRQKPLVVAQLAGITCNLAVVCGWVFNNWLH